VPTDTGDLTHLIARATSGAGGPVYLVTGDRVLAEPAAERLASAVAEKAGCPVETHRRPPRLAPILGDLRTFALFAPAKVVLAVETGALADRSAAATFLDDAAEALPLGERAGGDLSQAERRAAVRLLQAIRLFDLDPYQGEPAAVLSQLPDWAFSGASGRRTRKKAEEIRTGLADLLAGARRAEVQGFGQEEVSDLAAVVRDGLPEGHVLVLAESAAAAGHPIVEALESRKAVLRLAKVESDREGWKGLSELAAELARQTGMGIDRPALEALARRTLRGGSGWGTSPAESDSTARLAGEYRKLANLAQGLGRGRITVELVEDAVEDRGQEDVFKVLDAVGEGRGGEALDRLTRYLASAPDQVAARLSFFGLFAGFCRNLTAVSGMMRAVGVRAGERNYGRFKSSHAPRLQGDLGGVKSPLAGLHPFRLHRAYLAASSMDEGYLARLPWRVLETELALKGESGDPAAALGELIAEVAAQAGGPGVVARRRGAP
jgi:DNA polymerase III delta subunit